MIKKLLHEPLLHFLILGGLLFFYYNVSQSNEENENRIIVSKARIAQLTSAWEKKLLKFMPYFREEKHIRKVLNSTEGGRG